MGGMAPELLQLLVSPLTADPRRVSCPGPRMMLGMEVLADAYTPPFEARGAEERGSGETLPRMEQGRMMISAQPM